MGKVIKITTDYKSTEQYRSMLTNAIEKLEDIEENLNSLIVNLATAGKWKEWSDSIPVGGTFKFTEEMLKDTGDNNINDIAGLLDEVIRVKERIKTAGNNGYKI